MIQDLDKSNVWQKPISTYTVASLINNEAYRVINEAYINKHLAYLCFLSMNALVNTQ